MNFRYNKITMIIFILLFSFPIIFGLYAFLNIYKNQVTLFHAEKSLNSYIEKNKIDKNEYYFSFETFNNYALISLTNKESLNKKLLLSVEKNISDITDKLLKQVPTYYINNHVKDVYVDLFRIYDTNIVPKRVDPLWLFGVEKIEPNLANMHLKLLNVELLYENQSNIDILKNKKIAYINNIKVIDEVNNIDNISHYLSLLKLEQNKVITIFNFQIENKDYLVYYDITNDNVKVSIFEDNNLISNEKLNSQNKKMIMDYINNQ